MSCSSTNPPPYCSAASTELKLYQAFVFSVPVFFTFILLLLFYLFYLKRRRANWQSIRMRTNHLARGDASRVSLPFIYCLFSTCICFVLFYVICIEFGPGFWETYLTGLNAACISYLVLVPASLYNYTGTGLVTATQLLYFMRVFVHRVGLMVSNLHFSPQIQDSRRKWERCFRWWCSRKVF